MGGDAPRPPLHPHVSLVQLKRGRGSFNLDANGLNLRGISLLTAFGLFAVSAMLVSYALEARSYGWVLVFALSCWLGSTYGFLQGAWPFGIVEAIWGVIALRRWSRTRKAG